MKDNDMSWINLLGIIFCAILLNIISGVCVFIATYNNKLIGNYNDDPTSSWVIKELDKNYYFVGLLILAICFTLIYLKLIKPRMINIFKGNNGFAKISTVITILLFLFVNAVIAFFTEIACTGIFSTYEYPKTIYLFLGYIIGFLVIDTIITKRKNEKVI